MVAVLGEYFFTPSSLDFSFPPTEFWRNRYSEDTNTSTKPLLHMSTGDYSTDAAVFRDFGVEVGSGNIGRVVRVLTYFIGLLPPAKIIIMSDTTISACIIHLFASTN